MLDQFFAFKFQLEDDISNHPPVGECHQNHRNELIRKLFQNVIMDIDSLNRYTDLS